MPQPDTTTPDTSNDFDDNAGDDNGIVSQIEIVADEPLWRYPLTGVASYDDIDPRLRRVLAVKVGNGDPRNHPQTGLNAADVIFEELVEGRRTRLLTLYHSHIPPRIGPVRSSRTTDIDLLTGLAEPYLVSSGANEIVHAELRAADRQGLLIDGGALNHYINYARDPNRPQPFNLYYDYDLDEDGAPTLRHDLDNPDDELETLEVTPQLFNVVYDVYDGFGNNGFDNDGFDATSAEAAATSADVDTLTQRPIGIAVTYTDDIAEGATHIWDNDAWVRVQWEALQWTIEDAATRDPSKDAPRSSNDNADDNDTNGVFQELRPSNVVVLETRYVTAASDFESPKAVSFDEGKAWIATRGEIIEGNWQRSQTQTGYFLSDSQGEPVFLSPGQTWVFLANTSPRFPTATIEILTAPEGRQLLAQARTDAAANPPIH